MVTDCTGELRLEEPIFDPARLDWCEVSSILLYIGRSFEVLDIKEDEYENTISTFNRTSTPVGVLPR